MIKSMTGFGKGEEKSPYGSIVVEIKTLNHRSLDVICSPFNGLFLLEEKIKKIVEGKMFRGKVFVRIEREEAEGKESARKIEMNENVAKEYLRKIQKVQKNLGVGGEIQIGDLIAFPGVMRRNPGKEEVKLWPYIKKAAEKALKNLLAYRKSEGMSLARDFNSRLRKIKGNMTAIKKFGKRRVAEHRKKLVKSVKDIAAGPVSDKSRLETEVALFARNCDIAEEITRLSGHLIAYKETMDRAKTDTGKKLDFIAQEMQREVNTIGAKSNDFSISKSVINIKSQIEKMREQIKNVE
ncbi:MAG: YicC/YloC family endoribonuclease [Candidatus Omnitrophota bacterium]